MKLAWYRANPNWIGVFECNLKALAAIGERFVRIVYPAFGINEVFEIQDIRLNIASGDILQSVTITAQSMPSAAYEWDADQDEGEAPVADDTDVDNTIPVPEDFDVVIGTTEIGGSTRSGSDALMGRATVGEPDRRGAGEDGLGALVDRYRGDVRREPDHEFRARRRPDI